MLIKRGTAEDVYAVVLQRLSDTAKTGLFESQSPGVEPHTRWQHIWRRRHREPWVRLLPMVHPAWWPMPSEGIEGDEWGAYVVLERSSVTEHGMV